ncbi:MAG: hypothetical protein JNK04_06025, partial [Myxococcales bacterium]|nr:hypothetical protein [Myxococcales bacterium]
EARLAEIAAGVESAALDALLVATKAGNATDIDVKTKVVDQAKADRVKAVDAANAARAKAITALEEYTAALKQDADAVNSDIDRELADDQETRKEAERDALMRDLWKRMGPYGWRQPKVEALVAAADSIVAQDLAAAQPTGDCKSKLEAAPTMALVPYDQRESVAIIACGVAVIERELVKLRRQANGFRGARTNCVPRKFGFYAGYPAIFDAETIIESRTVVSRAERDITPAVSVGALFAPNALVGFTIGPWFGNAEVAPEDGEFIWGLTAGVAVTNDVLSALAD